jgi:hypothetical protein
METERNLFIRGPPATGDGEQIRERPSQSRVGGSRGLPAGTRSPEAGARGARAVPRVPTTSARGSVTLLAFGGLMDLRD